MVKRSKSSAPKGKSNPKSRSRQQDSSAKRSGRSRSRSSVKKSRTGAKSRRRSSSPTSSGSEGSSRRHDSPVAANPKRPLNGYNIYVREQMQNRKFTKGQVALEMSNVAAKWMALSEDEKKKYKGMAADANRGSGTDQSNK